MDIYYNNTKLYKNNLPLSKEITQNKPNILFNLNPTKYYTMIFFDPDAIGGNKIHWLVININNNDIKNSKTLFDYKGPEPPINSGIHHYVFCLLEQNSFINNFNFNFHNRFIDLKKLFIGLNFNKLNIKIISIKYFVIKT